MAHRAQRAFTEAVKTLYPEFFQGRKVLDVGSLDINGSNRDLFDDTCEYTGIDVAEGKNVDVVSIAHEFDAPDETYDVVISTECFEHDPFFGLTLRNIARMLKRGGLFVFTCATTGRPEHGTRRAAPESSPLSLERWGDYYRNLTEEDIRPELDIARIFPTHVFQVNTIDCDLYFYGVKHG
jgi:SAM-dependent methyltransferase